LKRHWGGRRGGSKGAQTTNPRIVMGGVQCPLCHDGDERRDSGGDLATVGKAIGERGERVGITSRTLSAVGWGASGENSWRDQAGRRRGGLIRPLRKKNTQHWLTRKCGEILSNRHV